MAACVKCSKWIPEGIVCADCTRDAQAQQRPVYTPPRPQAQPFAQTPPPAGVPMQAPGFRCRFCQSTAGVRQSTKISDTGWIVLVIMLLFCFPLFWIGLLIKEPQSTCLTCGSRLG